jgi:hypothetical protein
VEVELGFATVFEVSVFAAVDFATTVDDFAAGDFADFDSEATTFVDFVATVATAVFDVDETFFAEVSVDFLLVAAEVFVAVDAFAVVDFVVDLDFD